MPTLIERLGQAWAKQNEQRIATYDEAVKAAATNAKRGESELLKIVEASGRTWGEFMADVERMRQRIADHAKHARQQDLKTEIHALNVQKEERTARFRQDLEDLKQAYAADITPTQDRIDSLGFELNECRAARQRLIDTASPELCRREAELLAAVNGKREAIRLLKENLNCALAGVATAEKNAKNGYGDELQNAKEFERQNEDRLAQAQTELVSLQEQLEAVRAQKLEV